MSDATTSRRPRGRPSTGEASAPTDADLLDAALEAFAEHGFAGTSVREVARRLGVSHNLIPQRFGSKERLWYAAVDHGFGRLADVLAGALDDAPDDELGRLRAMIVRFVEANAARPALLRIVNQEAVSPSPRLDHLVRNYIDPVRELGDGLLAELDRRGEVRTRSAGLVYFFMTNGAGGPTVFPGLAERLGVAVDPTDADAVHRHAVAAVDVLFDGLGIRDAGT